MEAITKRTFAKAFGEVFFVDDQLRPRLEWELILVVLHSLVLVLRNLRFLGVLEALLKLLRQDKVVLCVLLDCIDLVVNDDTLLELIGREKLSSVLDEVLEAFALLIEHFLLG